MNCVVEVGVATAMAEAIAPTVATIVKVFFTVVRLFTQTALTSARLLRSGRSSLSAVPGDINLNIGGRAVVAA